MKKTNKGFSLVELIIVIAIMAILAGALAPALIKYINKSRLSTDIQTAQTVVTACQAAFASEKAYDACTQYAAAAVDVATIGANGATDDFITAFSSALGTAPANIKGKAKKGVDGTTVLDQKIYLKADPTQNIIEVYVGGTTADHMAYPTVGKFLAD